MMTPKDHMSQDLSYFSGPSTSGAGNKDKGSGPGPQNARIHPRPSVGGVPPDLSAPYNRTAAKPGTGTVVAQAQGWVKETQRHSSWGSPRARISR